MRCEAGLLHACGAPAEVKCHCCGLYLCGRCKHGLSLSDALLRQGLGHRPRSNPNWQGREVFELETDVVVFTGTAFDCWPWLRGRALRNFQAACVKAWMARYTVGVAGPPPGPPLEART